ncbi:MAG TPA: NAD/NADP octopine/nopaline dehydrogenase family protein [Pseudothermotoga sp.]|nr:NAD/NADP octopine/nopaline dehydrogenase family protein [Pseudothermotoga sp.]HOK83970.1 NAD/NADP octopine/nopaline dehydrogenase family protein [Pseudothermotoga sp.]HPP70953.1 NAD/NADP octopine/nopaline dehydrogenase family protein [Pseudothermotoga sp.]
MKICVIGAGNGGQALAAYLALRGFDVALYNRSAWRIAPIVKTNKIKVEGEINATAEISFATTDIVQAIRDRQLLMVVVPAFAHRDIVKKIAPLLEDGQVVVLNPGRTAGALEFYNTLKEENVRKNVVIAEAQTFVFASRASNPGVVRIFRIKNAVPVAALPSRKNRELEKTLLKVMPEFEIAPSTLYTSFNNIGAVFHPATIILNTGWVESTFGKFEFYFEGISQSVAKVLEAIDRERCEVAKKFGIEPMTAVQWLAYAYDVRGSNLYDAIHNNEGYRGIQAPTSLENRYILEDVPTSLVPISAFGQLAGVRTPVIDSIIQLSSLIMEIDFFKEGRNFEKLHLQGKTIEQIKHIMEEGEV